MLIYIIAISLGAERYLPYQTAAPGVFREYSYTEFSYFGLFAVALFCNYMTPKRLDLPSDWYLVIFNLFLFAPSLTLGIGSENISIEKKLIVIPAIIFVMLIIQLAGQIKIGKPVSQNSRDVNKKAAHLIMLAWILIFISLVAKYRDVMQFSTPDLIYQQRELVSDVGGVWGYIQLYSTYVFSTFLIAYGMSSGRWRYFFTGSAGYVVMYLITAERSVLIFPIFFLLIYQVAKNNVSLENALRFFLIFVSVVIFGVIFFSNDIIFFDLAGFYLFTRVIATPGQFILDYYDFFSTNGYTFFSQVRGLDMLVDVPSAYVSDPKWPQLGWLVGRGAHGIESNSNATFIASDGAASLGALGMILMACFLSVYLVIVNTLSSKFSKIFWSIIFAQQAFLLISASFFSILLSFGGFFYLVFFFTSNRGAVARTA